MWMSVAVGKTSYLTSISNFYYILGKLCVDKSKPVGLFGESNVLSMYRQCPYLKVLLFKSLGVSAVDEL